MVSVPGIFVRFILLLGVAVTASPGAAGRPAQARLVHCADETCLRIAGHRTSPAIAVRFAGRDIAVVGGRSWHATVPLTQARDWAIPAGGTLPVTLVDPRDGTETHEAVELPPGAIGPHVDLAMLVVRAN